MPIVAADQQQLDYLVSGIIINDPNGPRRWCDWVSALTPRGAEDAARDAVWAMTAEGRHGILFVANVIQLCPDADGNLGIQTCDTYATYADDPARQDGVAPPAGYTPPKGYEGWARPFRF